MTDLTIRNFVPADAARMFALQQSCLAVCPDTGLFNPGFFSAPGFDEGRNIFIAEDEQSSLVGYGLIYPQYLSPRLNAYVFWTDLRALPDRPDALSIKDALLERVQLRAVNIRPKITSGKAVLASTYFRSGQSSIDYLLSRGFRYYETVFFMRRDLSQPVADAPQPAGIRVTTWRMERDEDLQAYLDAYQESFGFCDWTLPDLRHFLGSDMMQAGACLAAFDGDKLVGSALAYFRPGEEDNPEQKSSTEHIFVRPGYRGRGIARALVTAGLRYLRECELKWAELEVVGDNRGALRLYESCGYQLQQEELSFARPLEQG